MEILCFTLYFLNMFSIREFKKCVPLSLISALGTPNLAKVSVLRNFTTTLASFVGMSHLLPT